jgi:hypothetical protein
MMTGRPPPQPHTAIDLCRGQNGADQKEKEKEEKEWGECGKQPKRDKCDRWKWKLGESMMIGHKREFLVFLSEGCANIQSPNWL